jgi:dynein heavy chain, axonemal
VAKLEAVQTVGAAASKERGMLLALDKMEADWAGLDFRVLPYKDTGKAGCCCIALLF